MGTMQAPEAYVAELLAALEPLPAVVLPLAEAHGLILAEDAAAALPVPPWTNSAMDGYAVRAADAAGADQSPVVLPVDGDVPAGAGPAPRTRRDGRTDGNGRYGRAAEAKRNPAPLTGPCAQSVTKSAAEARPPGPAPLGKPQ